MIPFRPVVLLLALTASLTLPATAQDPLKTKPHISLAFPFEEIPEGIGVSYPVAINTTTILPPSDVLRIIYVPLTVDDARVVQEQRQDQQGVAYTKRHQLDAMTTDEDALSPEARALLKMIRETHWDTKKMYQLALANQPGADLRVVHANRQTGELKDSAIALPDGLLLGAPNNMVTVLAVEEGSRSEAAGLRANDVILKVADIAMDGDLETYLRARSTAKKRAELSSSRRYVMIVQNVEEDAPREAVFQLPPSLNNGFMDQPIDIAPAKEKPALPPTDVWRDTKPKPE